MQHKGTIKKTLTILEYIILVLGLIFLAFVFINTSRGRAVDIFGMNILHVVTGSMEPTIEKGQYVLVVEKDLDKLAEEDIIAYYSEDPDVYGKIVIHRVIEINDDETYVTKGDANTKADDYHVRKDQIIGRYTSEIWFLDWLTSFTDMKKLMLMVVVIPLFLVCAYEFSTVTKLFYKLKSEEYREKQKEKGIETMEEKLERLKREAVEEYLRQQDSGAEVAANEVEDTDTKPTGQ
ncbi:MAG: signal peptidase I [Lachnospiraceae bacterium]|nr:signal peptidase I [Lachnospiraceae bacterium]